MKLAIDERLIELVLRAEFSNNRHKRGRKNQPLLQITLRVYSLRDKCKAITYCNPFRHVEPHPNLVARFLHQHAMVLYKQSASIK